jgi:hypothetical protein
MVWRIQNERGHGPYVLGDVAVPPLDSEESYMDARPAPSTDFSEQEYYRDARADDEKHRLLYGFDTPEDAARWFGGQNGLKELEQKGFKLTQVPAIKAWKSQSGRQLMFWPKHASIRVRAKDLPARSRLRWREHDISLEALGGET